MARRWCLSPAVASMTQFIIILLLSSAATCQNTETHSFGPLSDADVGKFCVLPIASVTDAIQLIYLHPYAMPSASGRVFFKKPFKMWEDHPNGTLASFNTSFLFTVSRYQNASSGEGLAFLISPSPSIPPYSSYGYLGLTSFFIDGKASNQIVAIELDTTKDEYVDDPDDNHIGLDINSVRSNFTVSLSRFNLSIAPEGYYVVWVEYDGVNTVIDVYMAPQPDKDAPIVEKPKKPVLSSGLDLRGLVNQESYFGFSASSGDAVQFYSILKWNLSVEVLPDESNSVGLPWKLIAISVVIGVPLLVLLVAGVTGVVYYLRKNVKVTASDPKLLSTLKRLPGTPREFSFRELKKATDNFDDKHKLGQGGYGVVYKGILPKENLEMAVKKFSRDSMKSIDDFLAELTIINRLRHKNLVRLIGN